MSVSKAQRKLVFERAKHCCEYCRLSALSDTVAFHIDHIIPLKHDGDDDINNLCLACLDCNTHKSHDLTGFDPDTGKITQLFNPRTQDWNKHFIIQNDMQIIGTTPTGRTTVRVLKINDNERLDIRQVLAEVGEYPCEKNNS